MPRDRRPELDTTDRALLEVLQRDGRVSTANLAREVAMSPSSTADRVRRLVDEGVVRGYRAVVDPAALGYPLRAFVRLRLAPGTGRSFREMLDAAPQIREAHHMTGDGCYLVEVVARSMDDLEELTDRFTTFGHVTTDLVFSSPIDGRPLPPA